MLYTSTEVYGASVYHSVFLHQPGGFCNKPSPVCCKPTSNHPRFDFLVRNLVPHAKSGIIPSSCKNPSQFNINNVIPQPSSFSFIFHLLMVLKCVQVNCFRLLQLQNITGKLQQSWEVISCPSSVGVQALESAWKLYGKCSGFTQESTLQWPWSSGPRHTFLTLWIGKVLAWEQYFRS